MTACPCEKHDAVWGNFLPNEIVHEAFNVSARRAADRPHLPDLPALVYLKDMVITMLACTTQSSWHRDSPAHKARSIGNKALSKHVGTGLRHLLSIVRRDLEHVI